MSDDVEQAKEWARGLQARRTREAKPCLECGKIIERAWKRQLYCGNACTLKASRRRQKAERQAAPEAGE